MDRVEKVRKLLGNYDGIMLSGSANIFYTSGFTGSNGLVVITCKGQYLYTDSRYTVQAGLQAANFEIIECSGSLFAEMTKLGLKSVGFEANKISYSQYGSIKEYMPNCALHDCSALIARLRCIKDENEICLMKNSIALADKAFEHVCSKARSGVKEIDLTLEIEWFLRKNGAQRLSFETIVASGVRSAMPHAEPSEKVIEAGDFVVLDFGCVLEGYCSDITRTIMVGDPSKRHMEIYNAVLLAQSKAIEAIAPTVASCDVDGVARSVLSGYGLDKYFAHGLGHGIGVEVHEEIRLSNKVNTPLETGMVLTVEPGVYIQDFGGVRIEDMIVVTDNGNDNITSSSKKMIIV